MNEFYPIFQEKKNDLIHQVILPCLALTPREGASFYEDSDEFILCSMQVVERDIRANAKFMAMKTENEKEQEIKQFETLKTYAADLLNSLCQFQDGTLTQIYEHAFDILENKVKGLYSKSTMMIVMTCLRTQIKSRKDLQLRLVKLMLVLFDVLPLPVVDENNKKEEDIEYAFMLLLLSKTVLTLKEINPQIIPFSFKIGFAVLQSTTTSEVHKSFVLDIFSELSRI